MLYHTQRIKTTYNTAPQTHSVSMKSVMYFLGSRALAARTTHDSSTTSDEAIAKHIECSEMCCAYCPEVVLEYIETTKHELSAIAASR